MTAMAAVSAPRSSFRRPAMLSVSSFERSLRCFQRYDGGRGASPDLGLTGSLTQKLQLSLKLTAATLNDRGEFLALGQSHADALDHDVGDVVALIGAADPPIDQDRPSTARSGDLALNNGAPLAIKARAAHGQRLTRKGARTHRISMNDKGLEEPYEFLTLRIARCRPIASEHETGDRRNIEALAEEDSKLVLALGFGPLRCQDIDGRRTKIGDETRWVVGSTHRRR